MIQSTVFKKPIVYYTAYSRFPTITQKIYVFLKTLRERNINSGKYLRRHVPSTFHCCFLHSYFHRKQLNEWWKLCFLLRREGVLSRINSLTAYPTSRKKQSAAHSHWIDAPYSVAPSQPGVPARQDSCLVRCKSCRLGHRIEETRKKQNQIFFIHICNIKSEESAIMILAEPAWALSVGW